MIALIDENLIPSTQENNAMTAISSQTAILDAADSRGKSEADATRSEDESLASTLLEGGTWQDWAHQQVHQMVQNAYANVLVNTFNMDPDTANYLAGYKMSADAAKKARHAMGVERAALTVTGTLLSPFTMGASNLLAAGIATGAMNDHMVSGMSNLELKVAKSNGFISRDQYQSLSGSVNAEQNLQDYKVQGYTMASDNILQHNFGVAPEKLDTFNEYIGDYFTSQQAKHEMQSEGSGFGIRNFLGNTFGKLYAGIGKAIVDGGKDLGLISKRTARADFRNIDTVQDTLSGNDLIQNRQKYRSAENEAVNKAYLSQLYSPIAEAWHIDPKDFGEAVYTWNEHQEAKKAAKEAKIDAAKQIVELAGLIAATVLTLGSDAPLTIPAMLQVAAISVGTGAVNATIDATNGNKNGAIADLVDGAIGAAAGPVLDYVGDAVSTGISAVTSGLGTLGSKFAEGGQWLANTTFGKFIGNIGTGIGSGASALGSKFAEGGQWLANTTFGKFIGNIGTGTGHIIGDGIGGGVGAGKWLFNKSASLVKWASKNLESSGVKLAPEITWTPGEANNPNVFVGPNGHIGGSGHAGGWGFGLDIDAPEAWTGANGYKSIPGKILGGAFIGYNPTDHTSEGITLRKIPHSGDTSWPIVFTGGDNPGFHFGISLPEHDAYKSVVAPGGMIFDPSGNTEISRPSITSGPPEAKK